MGKDSSIEHEDAASRQLQTYKKDQKTEELARGPDGIPYPNLTSTLTVSPHGPPLLQDTQCIGLLQNWTRKNTPVRYVHAVGTGSFGHFQCTNPEMRKFSRAKLFDNVNTKTPIFIRFGLSDNPLEPHLGRRFFWSQSVKFYTPEGNMDILNINSPVFTFRDAFNFINQHLAQFPPPAAFVGFSDPSAYWDYVILRPELAHRVILLFSDRGQPLTLRHISYFPINVYRLVSQDGDWCYARFEFRTDQGNKFLTSDQASTFKKEDQDFAIRDLYNAIEAKDYPSWTWYMQTMDKDEPAKYLKKTGWSAFDLTKVWPHSLFPRIEVGKLTVNRNPDNQFSQTEQSAFNPGSLVPGIEPALEDKLFHGRIFAYNDAQMYRLGPKKSTIPINQPSDLLTGQSESKADANFKTYFHGGLMNYDPTNQGGQPIYAPNHFNGPTSGEPRANIGQHFEGVLDYYDANDFGDDNFGQPRIFYENVIKEDERSRLAENLAKSIKQAKRDVQKKAVDFWGNVSAKLARDIQKAIDESP